MRAGTGPWHPGARLGAWAVRGLLGRPSRVRWGAGWPAAWARGAAGAGAAGGSRLAFLLPLPFLPPPSLAPVSAALPPLPPPSPIRREGRSRGAFLPCKLQRDPPRPPRDRLRELPRPRRPGTEPWGEAGRRAPPGWGLRAVPAPPRLPASSPRQLPRDSPLCWMRTRAHRPRGPA